MAFMKEFVGKQENFDSGTTFNGQCTQIVKRWCQRNGWSIPNGGGEDAWGYRNYRNGFSFVRNSRYAIPEVGDIVIFNKAVMHVSIALPSDDLDLACFGENYMRSKKCAIEVHRSYSGVFGWLHWNK